MAKQSNINVNKLREVLDNSQSLLVMILSLGEEYSFYRKDISNISKDVWAEEGLTKLLTDQIIENRFALDQCK